MLLGRADVVVRTGAEQRAGAGRDRVGDALPRLDRIEGEQHGERLRSVPTVVARVREQPSRRGAVASRGGLDVVDPGERAPGPCVVARGDGVAPRRAPASRRHAAARRPSGRPRRAGCRGGSATPRPRCHRRARAPRRDRCELVARSAAGGGEREKELERRPSLDLDRRQRCALSDRHRTHHTSVVLSPGVPHPRDCTYPFRP